MSQQSALVAQKANGILGKAWTYRVEPREGHDDDGTGALDIWGEAERAGTG